MAVLDLFYKADDGTYHKLSAINELEETIMEADDALLSGYIGINTVRTLKDSGAFERELRLEANSNEFIEFMEKIHNDFEKIIKTHAEYYDLMWICELAKRWLKEHVGNGSSDLS